MSFPREFDTEWKLPLARFSDSDEIHFLSFWLDFLLMK